MRKIKFCTEAFKEKLTAIVDQFPQLQDIHPFFSDMLNILYDKDHYKIALSQVNIVRTVVEKICSDYLKLIKFSDSLYRCK
jgi:nucleolar GTP-binding protein